MNLSELAHSRLLISQRLYRLTQTMQFVEAENIATDEQRLEMKRYIESGELSKLEDLIYNMTRDNLEFRFTKELRQIAKGYNVPYYREISREELILEIQRARVIEDGRIRSGGNRST
jgi:hypothetical protein